jgi:hypothetical protein
MKRKSSVLSPSAASRAHAAPDSLPLQLESLRQVRRCRFHFSLLILARRWAWLLRGMKLPGSTFLYRFLRRCGRAEGLLAAGA